ncbi:MAG: hypothetical protein JST39_12705, partial [Bacteroidetes bacterium]|nr:hypothetical protein [Bacteroidota bacterium]
NIDTFRIRYQVEASHGRLREMEEPFYAGFSNNVFSTGNATYRQLVLGDNAASGIAYVRQDNNGLMFLTGSGEEQEKALLYFNKSKGASWKVHIDNSYFWRKLITFMGKIHSKRGDVYVYDVRTDDGYTSLGNHLTRIYYSREKGFMKFAVQMPWANVGIVRAE